MANLLQNIRAVLKNQYTPLWFPGLASPLTAQRWRTLYRQTAITRNDYGTGRVRVGRAEAPRHIVGSLLVSPGNGNAASALLVELLSENERRNYEGMGLTFYSGAELAASTIFDCLQDAIHILAHVPTLQETVNSLVRVCHILKPEDDDYDVSHSDPYVPFSIFVSVPQQQRENCELRIAESIVHEAMHLQLTLLEQALPLIRPSNDTYFSPWKGELRSPQGILHALYVFRVIDQFLGQLLTLSIWSSESVYYMRNRRTEVAQQVRRIEPFADCPALTELGTCLVQRLL